MGQPNIIVDSTSSFSENSMLEIDSSINETIINDQNTEDLTNQADSIKAKTKSVLDSPIEYSAVDSILFSLDNKKVYLYGDAMITYQDMELKAAFIELDMDKNELYSTGMPDTTGEMAGYPHFKEGNEEYDAKEMRYNFKTKRGIIKEVKTEQSDGYLHAELTKKHENGEIHMHGGKYTTCDADHPHFYLALTRAKVIPNDKIVSGPAYMVIEDVPLYFPIVPFGFFPSSRKHSSGIILPEYGEEQRRGFYLRGGGYYFAINDYLDFTLMGDFFTNRTWGTSSRLNYRKRYKYSGNTEMRYYSNVDGDPDIPYDQTRTTDFSLRWSHRQDPKSNPYNRLSGSVNFSTSSFDENYSKSPNDYLNNTKQSNIAFSKSWPNKPFNFSANLRHQQNRLSEGGEKINFTFPSLDFNVSRQYPFRGKNISGKLKWYQNIGFDYKAQMQNKLETNDSLFFDHFEFDKKDLGFQHRIPISTSIKFLRFFTFSPGVSYTGVVATKKIHSRDWVWNDEARTDGAFVDSITEGFYYLHGYSPNASVSANPTLYGMYQFKKGSRVEAIRHVFDPNVSFSFVPDMKDLVPKYYRTVYNPETEEPEEYSIYKYSLYNTPTLPPGRSGRISFSLRNNVEMKVNTYSDTTQEQKKIKIIENLNMSTSYNVFADSTQQAWSSINMSTSNKFFKDKLNVRFTAVGNIYAIDSLKQREYKNKYIWESTDKLLRITKAGVSFGSSFRSMQGGDKEEEGELPTKDDIETITEEEIIYTEYVDFNVPWDFRFDYSFVYSKALLTEKITQTLGFSGNFSLTPKWKVSFRSGWDFEQKQLTYTTVNVHRDLHCWEARFNWVPFGYMKSYGFTISAKASILRDLKWDKPKESWYDNR
ncbi:putative LPS assembly protein LptD [Bacteroidota bacterium]